MVNLLSVCLADKHTDNNVQALPGERDTKYDLLFDFYGSFVFCLWVKSFKKCQRAIL